MQQVRNTAPGRQATETKRREWDSKFETDSSTAETCQSTGPDSLPATLTTQHIDTPRCDVTDSCLQTTSAGIPISPDQVSDSSVCASKSVEACNSFQPKSTSTPHGRCRRTLAFEAEGVEADSLPDSDSYQGKNMTRDAATSPKKPQPIRSLEELQAPFTKEEEAYFTHFVRLKMQLSEDKETVICKTGGQPIVLKKTVKPRKSSGLAGSPLTKKRAKQMENLREQLSGTSVDDTIRQQGTELKLIRKNKRKKILDSAGYRQPYVSAKEAVRNRARLALSMTKHRQYRKMMKKAGVKLDSENQERQFQRELVCGKVRISQCALYFFNKATNTETERDMPVATIEDVPVFVSSLLIQYESKSKLTWHKGQIPSDEIWLASCKPGESKFTGKHVHDLYGRMQRQHQKFEESIKTSKRTN